MHTFQVNKGGDLRVTLSWHRSSNSQCYMLTGSWYCCSQNYKCHFIYFEKELCFIPFTKKFSCILFQHFCGDCPTPMINAPHFCGSGPFRGILIINKSCQISIRSTLVFHNFNVKPNGHCTCFFKVSGANIAGY